MFFHRISRKAFQGPVYRTVWPCGMVRCICLPPGAQCVISACPAMEKFHLVFTRAKMKAKVQMFCPLVRFPLKLSPIQPITAMSLSLFFPLRLGWGPFGAQGLPGPQAATKASQSLSRQEQEHSPAGAGTPRWAAVPRLPLETYVCRPCSC